MSMTTLQAVILLAVIFVGVGVAAKLFERRERKADEARRKAYDLGYKVGYFDGWKARHANQPIDYLPPSTKEIGTIFPAVVDTDTVTWMREGDHMLFEQWRWSIVCDLNREMKREMEKNVT